MLRRDVVETPIGALVLITDGEGAVHAAAWEERFARMEEALRRESGGGFVSAHENGADAGANFAADALRRYFAGDLDALGPVKVTARGTSFQQSVWAASREIKPGQTVSYAALAAQTGRATACRAVGMANGANPVCVIIPCHRVIGANGSLTGYGGGLHRKQWLLRHEAAGGDFSLAHSVAAPQPDDGTR